ncbi:helix-turn-helix domain-containing protein [Gilvimarinus polysaccharolyticus]|uniref:helix-turn-helix domain-containing protein n=1 Tax=Gilvimarinus polysaccharolyticus TaxID=863921 RepID=UPI0009FF2BF8|nr:helix-turn-helix transcriptional regulator [Gilvimarinus polysaccharolyticus]
MGFNRNVIALFYKETAQRIELDATDKLCDLFDCDVAGLLGLGKLKRCKSLRLCVAVIGADICTFLRRV